MIARIASAVRIRVRRRWLRLLVLMPRGGMAISAVELKDIMNPTGH
jgi:hypothetical protein